MPEHQIIPTALLQKLLQRIMKQEAVQKFEETAALLAEVQGSVKPYTPPPPPPEPPAA